MLKSAFKLIHKLIHPQNAAKLTKIHGSELGVKLWCHLMPQVHCTTTVPQMYNCHKVILENLLSVWFLVSHKLVRSEPFLDYLHEVWQLLLALC